MCVYRMHAGNKTLLEYDDTWRSLVKQYEHCGYVVDPIKFPSRKAKSAARSMPQQVWPETRSKPKEEKEEKEEDEEQQIEQIMLAAEALEGNLREFFAAEAAEIAQQVSRPA